MADFTEGPQTGEPGSTGIPQDRFNRFEYPKDDFPFYNGSPVNISGPQWLFLMDMVTVGFLVLVAPLPIFEGLVARGLSFAQAMAPRSQDLPDSVAAFEWNGWQLFRGISGGFGLEYAAQTRHLVQHAGRPGWVGSRQLANSIISVWHRTGIGQNTTFHD
jgi:hypothetical protein